MNTVAQRSNRHEIYTAAMIANYVGTCNELELLYNIIESLLALEWPNHMLWLVKSHVRCNVGLHI